MMTKLIFLVFFAVLFTLGDAFGQCAMCRATLENNASNGVVSSANINLGILYLLVMPYLAISIIAFLWYKNTKKNLEKKQTYGGFAR